MSTSEISSSKRTLSAITGVALGVIVLGAVGFTLHSAASDPEKPVVATVNGTMDTPQGSLPHAFVELGVYPDKATAAEHGFTSNKNDWVQYGPSSHIVLPAHSYVTMTIKVYDSGEKLNNAFFGKIIGTEGGVATIDGVDQSSVPADQVQHTFTLHGLPTSSQDPLFVNVPLPRVQTDDKDNLLPTNDPGTNHKGHTVVFSFITGGKGEYVWNCEYPCGDGTYRGFGAVMGAEGYMNGKVTVQ
jgi:hypothetical protein